MVEWPITIIGELAADDDGAIAIGPFGSSMKADVYTETGIPVVRGNNLTGRPGFFGDPVFVSREVANRFARCLVRPGDLVFPHRGAIGEVGLVTAQGYDEWMLSTSMMKLRTHPAKLDPHFAFYYFRSPIGRHQLLRNASQVGTPGISQPLTSLRACEIKLPPLREQRKIVEVLQALDDKIEQNRRTIRALEELARMTFKAWFVDFEPVKAKAAGGTSFPGMSHAAFAALPERMTESRVGPVPQGWEIQPIGDLVSVKGGGTPSTKVAEYWDGGMHFWATPKDLSGLQAPVLLRTERRITDAGAQCISSGVMPENTVLLSSRAPVGYTALAKVPVAVNQGFIAMLCNGPLPPHYVLHWTRSALEEIKSRASGTTFPEISKSAFRPIPVVVPTPLIVEEFERTAQGLFDLIQASGQQSHQLGELRDYLLPKLLNGKVRVDK